MTRRFRQHPAAIFRRLTDGVVVLSLDGHDEDPLFLAGTGGDLWDVLATPHSLTELAGELGALYGQPPELIAQDIRGVLDELVEAAILTVEPADDTGAREPDVTASTDSTDPTDPGDSSDPSDPDHSVDAVDTGS